jgi:hypothetical protein
MPFIDVIELVYSVEGLTETLTEGSYSQYSPYVQHLDGGA